MTNLLKSQLLGFAPRNGIRIGSDPKLAHTPLAARHA